MAGVDGNRTHRRRDTPSIGFEDRERHQATNYSHLKYCGLVRAIYTSSVCVYQGLYPKRNV